MAKAIRGQATGSITVRGDALRIKVTVGTDEVTGRRKTLNATVRGTSDRSWREATRVKNGLLRQAGAAADSHGISTEVTLGAVLDEWLRLGAQTKAPSTVRTDLDNVKYLEPLRSLRVRDLSRKAVGAHYRELSLRGRYWVRGAGGRKPKPLGPSTVANVNRVLQAAINAAVEWEWLPVNPIYRATKPKVGRKIRSVADDAQWAAITGFFAGSEYEDYLRLALVTRMRRGELVALRWLDIEWDLGRLMVGRAASAGIIRDQTKTNMDRYVGLDAGTLEVLKRRKERCQLAAASARGQLIRNAYIFSSAPDGSVPWRAERFTHAFAWARAQLAEQDPPVDISNLRGADVTRHRGTTLLVRAGRDPAVIAKENGHSLATLFKHYAHEFGQGDAGNAAILSDQFLGNITEGTAPLDDVVE